MILVGLHRIHHHLEFISGGYFAHTVEIPLLISTIIKNRANSSITPRQNYNHFLK